MARRMLIVGHPGALGMEFLAARDIFGCVNLWREEGGEPPAYAPELATLDGSDIELLGGIRAGPCQRLEGWSAPIDTLIVAGGPHAAAAVADEALVDAVRLAATKARRLVSLCTGAYILASAGLLDGRRCTTHWRFGDDLAARYPSVLVDTDPIYIRDGDLWTSAGVTAGFDLLLALVEDDLGTDCARVVARTLVLFLRRTGNQPQFSAQLQTQLSDQHPLRETQQFIADHPEADLSLSALAARVHMSPRHFGRVFRAGTGISPGRYVERTRLETARRRLEESALPVDAIAIGCGFGSYEAMRRVFLRAFQVSPGEYRRRFGIEIQNFPPAPPPRRMASTTR